MEERKIKSRPRPLSPHLQVYKPQITSMLSIMHRGTGVALYISAFFFVAYLCSYAFWQEIDIISWLVNTKCGNFLGLPVAVGLSFALSYHFCNGIRHLFWDFGVGFDIKTTYKSGYAVIFGSLFLTASIWLAVFINGNF